jgi:hypothetical protein
MDELDMLRELVADENPNPTARETARAALLTRARDERVRPAWRPWSDLVGRHRRLLGVTAAVAIVCAVAIGQLPFGPRPNAAAAAALEDVARVAAAQPASATDGYRHTKSEGAELCGPAYVQDAVPMVLVPLTREIWIKSDGSGRIRETEGEPVFFSAADHDRWIAAGSPRLCGSTVGDQRFGPASATPPPESTENKMWAGSLSIVSADALPTDVAALTEYVRQRAAETGKPSGSATSLEMFTIVGDLLRETVAAPAVRAALYRVVAGIPGVELVGSVTDRAGRSGTAVAIVGGVGGSGSAEQTRRTLIFDPGTSLLLGEEEVLLDRVDWIAADPPVVLGYETYLVSDIVSTDN